MRSIVWFRDKDLRVADHAPLRRALEAMAGGGELVPLYVVEPAAWDPTIVRARRNQRQVHADAIGKLAESLRRLGSRLVCVEGDPVDLVPQVARALGATCVFAQASIEPAAIERDRVVAERLPGVSATLSLHGGETLVPPGSIRASSGAPLRVFSAFARAFHRDLRVEAPVPEPDRLPPIASFNRFRRLRDAGIVERFTPFLFMLGVPTNDAVPFAGETAAQWRLEAFLEDGLARYALDRDRLDVEGTTRLSAELAHGTISARNVWAAVESRLGEHPEGAAKLLNELLWREFAYHLLADEPELLEHPFRRAFEGLPVVDDDDAWYAWVEGRTGYPVVDAAARQLLAEGWISNRARMISASFLAKDLRLDFRRGEVFFMQRLVDADLANNDLGWQWSAGCGADAQPWFRVFNPVTQGERFDPDGTWVRRWVPELADVPARWIHQPWAGPSGHLKGLDYPPPIVDHAVARTAWLAAVRDHARDTRPDGGEISHDDRQRGVRDGG